MLIFLKSHWVSILRSILLSMGTIWLPLEAYEGLTNLDAALSFQTFLILSAVIGLLIYFIDGYFWTGFLKGNVIIRSNSFDTEVEIKFGDLFKQVGWKAISVNDFFDYQVDNHIVSENSLHGKVIKDYWGENPEGWWSQVEKSLVEIQSIEEDRTHGNQHRYQIGTTAQATNHGEKFLFFALGNTDIVNHVTRTKAADLIFAVRKMLSKARTICSNEPLNMPLFGSGLGRVGIKNSILVDLILAAVFEETKQSKITSKITIVLPVEKKGEINLGTVQKNWS